MPHGSLFGSPFFSYWVPIFFYFRLDEERKKSMQTAMQCFPIGKMGTVLIPFWNFGPIWDQALKSGPNHNACERPRAVEINFVNIIKEVDALKITISCKDTNIFEKGSPYNTYFT